MKLNGIDVESLVPLSHKPLENDSLFISLGDCNTSDISRCSLFRYSPSPRSRSWFETINCHARERTRNEKRQKLERRAPKALVLSSSFTVRCYCSEQRDTFAVNAVSKPPIRARALAKRSLAWRFLDN